MWERVQKPKDRIVANGLCDFPLFKFLPVERARISWFDARGKIDIRLIQGEAAGRVGPG